jgi:ABC-type glycerol-3-phosphate transport system permease component
MNNAKTTAISGCVIWFLLIFIISSCVMPVFFLVGSVTSFTDFAIKTTGGWLCPEGTTPESYTYASTTTDEFGNRQPATAYELHCVDSSGEVVKTDPVLYAFIWIGIFALIGLIISVILTFVFAVPGGMLVTKILNKLKVSRSNVNSSDY